MYFEHFGLKCPPFEETTSPSFFYETATHRRILQAVHSHLGEAGKLVLIPGQPGCGKTILGNWLLQTMSDKGKVLSYSIPPGGIEHLADRVAGEFNLTDKVGKGKAAAKGGAKAAHHMVLIDQADNLSHENLLDINRLGNRSEQHDATFSIVLIGGPILQEKLRSDVLKDLVDKLEVTDRLDHLTFEESRSYITSRLRAAGGETDDSVFTAEAIDRIASAASGQPRVINAMCRRAMNHAGRQQAGIVDLSLVNSSIADTNRSATASETIMDHGIGSAETDFRPLVRRLEELLAVAPSRLEEMELQATRIVEQAARNFEAVQHASLETDADEALTDIKVARLEHAKAQAESSYQKLSNFSRELANAGQSTEEQISLLLTSLQAAQGIHEKLEDVGREASQLVQEAQVAADEEREQLRQLASDLSSQREQISQMIAHARNERETTLAAERENTAVFLAEVLDEAKRARDDAARMYAEGLQTVKAAREEFSKLIEESATQRNTLAEVREAERLSSMHVVKTNEILKELKTNLEEASRANRKLTTQAEHAEKSKQDAVCEIEQAGERVQQGLEEAAANLERVQQAERNAQEVSQKTLEKAQVALLRVQECESTLADAQARSIDVKGIASATLASMQDQVKRAHESIETVISSGIDRVQNVSNTAVEDATRKLDELVNSAEKAATVATEQAAEGLSEVREHCSTELKSAEEAIRRTASKAVQTVEVASVGVKDTARRQIARIEQAAANCAEEAGKKADASAEIASESIRQAVGKAQEELRDTAEQWADQATSEIAELADHRATELGQRATELEQKATELGRRIAEMESTIIDGLQSKRDQVIASIEGSASDAIQGIEECGTRITDNVHNICSQSGTSLESAAKNTREEIKSACDEAVLRIGETSTKAVDDVEAAGKEVSSATSAAKAAALDTKQVTMALEALKAEAHTCGEQVNHLIRDVWSLTTTTDDRIKILNELTESSQNSYAAIEGAITKATENSETLAARTAAAEKAIEIHVAQQAKVKDACNAFSEKLAEAKRVNETINEGTAQGHALLPALAEHLDAIRNSLAESEAVMSALQAQEDSARRHIGSIEQFTSNLQTIEARIGELQEALASPLRTIHDARAQADELSDICLSVKRVFRAVSQTSLEANERIKSLSRLLNATENFPQVMQQWINEANRVQERLDSTIKKVPAIGQTHPMLKMPDAASSTIPSSLRGPTANILDLDNIQRAAGEQTQSDTASGVVRGQAGVREMAAEKRNLDTKQGVGSAVAKRTRLSPDDIQAIIADAKQKIAEAKA